MKMMIGLIAAVITAGAAYQAAAVFEPIALSVCHSEPLAIQLASVAYPDARCPCDHILCAIEICLIFASLVAWGFGCVGHSLIANSNRYQELYESLTAWLDQHGVSVAGIWAEHFNVSWLLRTAQQITGRINTTVNLWLVAFVLRRPRPAGSRECT